MLQICILIKQRRKKEEKWEEKTGRGRQEKKRRKKQRKWREQGGRGGRKEGSKERREGGNFLQFVT